MRRAAGVAIVVSVAACSQPKPDAARPSDDRRHPQEILVDELGRGEVRATAREEGTWWYVIRIEPLAPPTGRITITAREIGRAKERVRVDVIDGVALLAGTTTAGESRVVLAERAAARSLLVRVTTTDRAAFRVTVSRDDDPTPPAVCDLDNPDFSLPACCEADCVFGETCTAPVVRVEPAVTIAIGKSWRIMRSATGYLLQDGKPVSRVIVRQVEAEHSIVEILEWRGVQYKQLLENGIVVITAPEACMSRR